ncbi:MAG: ABC transporter ATP-binding protein [Acetobacteraceae bacterium]
MTASPLLSVRGLCAYYADMRALTEVSLEVMPGEIVAIVGANAAGKSTLLRALSGLVRWTGQISFRGEDLATVPAHAIVERGLVQVPEGRELFPFMTVEENLDVGSYSRRARQGAAGAKDKVFSLLPRLQERRTQLARTMSGGEQQMCAIGRGLMAQPELLLLDEPSLGLAPIIIRTIYEKLAEVNRAGTTVLLVEQNLTAALKLAHRAYVLQQGRVVLSGSSDSLRNDPRVRSAFLGQ